MTPNEIESTKERINFLSRILLAYIAGVYLLAGVAGNYLLDYLARNEIVWREFAVVLVIVIAGFAVLSLIAVMLYRKINGYITQIGESP